MQMLVAVLIVSVLLVCPVMGEAGTPGTPRPGLPGTFRPETPGTLGTPETPGLPGTFKPETPGEQHPQQR
jgi:hypothetical protein